MRLLLTGSTGFVGSHIHPQLAAAGFDVVCTTREPDQASKREPATRFCPLDLNDSRSIVEALRDVDAAVSSASFTWAGCAPAGRRRGIWRAACAWGTCFGAEPSRSWSSKPR